MAGQTERHGGRVVLLFAAILLAAGLLRLYAMPQSFWFDEIASVRFADEPLAHLWSDWMRRETNPPLYYTLLKGWSALFGGSDMALRMLSLLLEGAAICLAYLIGRKVGGDKAGLAAAALIAVSPAQVHYSLEVRGYAMAQLGALAAIYGLIGYCGRTEQHARIGWLALYVLGCVVASYAHTLLGLLPVLAGAWGLWWLVTVRRVDRPVVLEWATAHLLILLLCAWWWWLTVWHLQHSPNIAWIPRPGIADAVRYVLKIYGPDHADRLGDVPAYLILSLAVLPMTVFALWMIRSCRKAPALVLAICAIGSPTILFLISMAQPLLLPRTLFWSSGPMLVCFGIGFAVMPHRRAAGALLAILLGADLVGAIVLAPEQEEPFAQISRTLNAEFEGASVVTSEKTVAFGLARYCPEEGCAFDLHARIAPETFAADMPMPQIDDDAMIGLACRGRLVTVIRAPQPSPDALLEKVAIPVDLTSHFTQADLLKVTRWLPRRGAQCNREVAR